MPGGKHTMCSLDLPNYYFRSGVGN